DRPRREVTPMHTKADPPRLPEGDRPASAILSAYFEWNHLKQLYRQGWLRRGVPPARCESVAEHSFGVALLAMLLSQSHRPPLDPPPPPRPSQGPPHGPRPRPRRGPRRRLDPSRRHRRRSEACPGVGVRPPDALPPPQRAPVPRPLGRIRPGRVRR